MKIQKLTCLSLFIIILLCSCGSGDKMNIEVSDSSKNITELLTSEYLEDQLDYINSLDKNINDLNSEFPIQCVRKNKSNYQAVFRSNKSVLIITFDLNGDKISSQKFTTSKVKDDFDSIKIGQKLENVESFDKNGDYTFLYTGRIDVPRISSHYTIDGFMIRITYSEDNIITNISSQLI